MKFLIVATVAITSYFIMYIRRRQAHARLDAIDEGKLCIACHSPEMQSLGGNVRCLRCGHTVSLASLRGTVLSDREIDAMNKPDISSR